jgi:Domain of unknown function (DUF397)
LPELHRAWRKSSRSQFNSCVEVCFRGETVPVRNSRDPDGPVLVFTAPEWDAFVAGVKLGEFDRPRADAPSVDGLAAHIHARHDRTSTVRRAVVTARTERPMTTQPEPDPSDDYGYDLAHEVKSALRVPVRRREPTVSRGSDRPADSDGDLGYDDCHDL